MNLVVFFTYDVSLKTWVETGLLDREILLYERLAKLGVKVTFITYGNRSDYMVGKNLTNINILPIYSIIKKQRNKLIRFIQSFTIPLYLKKVIKGADILKANQMYGAWVPIVAKLIFNKKVIIRCGYEFYRNTFIRTTYKKKKYLLYKVIGFFISLFSYKMANRIIISNQADAEFIKRKFFVKSEKIFKLGNYIDVEQFRPHGPGQGERVLFVGRLSAQKNLFNLYQAIKLADIGLDIIGRGELRQKLNNLAYKTGIDVKYLGIFPNRELPKTMSKYKIVILPSFYENNPKVLLEAMACERAVIGTNVDGIKEVIAHGVTGLLCGTSSTSICKAIDRLRKDEKLCLRMGKSAKKFIEQHYSLDHVVKTEYNLYRGLSDMV